MCRVGHIEGLVSAAPLLQPGEHMQPCSKLFQVRLEQVCVSNIKWLKHGNGRLFHVPGGVQHFPSRALPVHYSVFCYSLVFFYFSRDLVKLLGTVEQGR